MLNYHLSFTFKFLIRFGSFSSFIYYLTKTYTFFLTWIDGWNFKDWHQGSNVTSFQGNVLSGEFCQRNDSKSWLDCQWCPKFAEISKWKTVVVKIFVIGLPQNQFIFKRLSYSNCSLSFSLELSNRVIWGNAV